MTCWLVFFCNEVHHLLQLFDSAIFQACIQTSEGLRIQNPFTIIAGLSYEVNRFADEQDLLGQVISNEQWQQLLVNVEL